VGCTLPFTGDAGHVGVCREKKQGCTLDLQVLEHNGLVERYVTAAIGGLLGAPHCRLQVMQLIQASARRENMGSAWSTAGDRSCRSRDFQQQILLGRHTAIYG